MVSFGIYLQVFAMFLPIALAVFVILVFYVLKRYIVEYVQWFRGVLHMRTLPGPPTKWGIGHMHMVGCTFYVVLQFLFKEGETNKFIG